MGRVLRALLGEVLEDPGRNHRDGLLEIVRRWQASGVLDA
jgi:hypothetical protein